jgi:protein-S-isoprenylcysteine O-methyltransferase Ste14
MATHARRDLAQSLLHNVGVGVVSFGVAFLGVLLDGLLGIGRFHTLPAVAAGCALLAAGFLLRTWAAFHFYARQMRVISLSPQHALIVTGPYRLSRNPLYLGGNVLMFLGAALVLGTPSGLALTVAHLPLVDRMIRREETQLERTFGEEWLRYRGRVRRWL